MIIDISVAVIALAVVALTIFSIYTLISLRKTLDALRKDIHHVSVEGVQLLLKMEQLSGDIKSKLDTFNFLFKPFKNMQKEKQENTGATIADWITTTIVLIDKIRRRYEK